MIPAISVLKAKMTGKPRLTIFNKPADLKEYIQNFYKEKDPTTKIEKDLWPTKKDASGKDIAKDIRDLTTTEARAIEAHLKNMFGVNFLLVEGSRTRSAYDISRAQVILSSKDIIFESIKGESGKNLMAKTKGAIMLADEAQFSLQLDIDYVMSEGERVRLVDRTDGMRYINTFDNVLKNTALIQAAMDHIDKGEFGLAKELLKIDASKESKFITEKDCKMSCTSSSWIRH